MLNQDISSSLGFIVLSFLTWSVTFAVLVFGVILRRKVLLWNDQWKEMVEQSGTEMKDFADDLERTFEKLRGTFRLLGFFLFVVLVLMGFVIYLGFVQKPILGAPQVTNSLWLLTLIALSAVLPAFVNFGVGIYITETMLLKANDFVFYEASREMRERRARIKALQKAKELQAQRQAAKAAQTQPAQG
jgi:hypothetical protein